MWTCSRQERKTSYQSRTICFWRKGVLWASFGTDDFLFAFMKVVKFCKGHFPPNICVWETRLGQQKRGFREVGATTWYDPFIDVTTSNRLNMFFSQHLFEAREKMCHQCVGKIFRALCVWYLRCCVSRLRSSHCLFSIGIVHLDLSMLCAKVEGPDSNVLEFLVQYIYISIHWNWTFQINRGYCFRSVSST